VTQEAPETPPDEEVAVDQEKPSPSQSDVLRALRATRASAKNNVKKTRMAFNATKAAEDSGLLKTQRFHKTDE
jgi:hypothetical protein